MCRILSIDKIFYVTIDSLVMSFRDKDTTVSCARENEKKLHIVGISLYVHNIRLSSYVKMVDLYRHSGRGSSFFCGNGRGPCENQVKLTSYQRGGKYKPQLRIIH